MVNFAGFERIVAFVARTGDPAFGLGGQPYIYILSSRHYSGQYGDTFHAEIRKFHIRLHLMSYFCHIMHENLLQSVHICLRNPQRVAIDGNGPQSFLVHAVGV